LQNQLSIQLPETLVELVNEHAFENYTTVGSNEEAKSRLGQLAAEDLFPDGIGDFDMAACCVSGIWLLHNFLHKSHDISQEVHTAEGSFWHAIMHRLEGDFWNSKYWYRKVGNHPTFEKIERNWNPEHYVDQCETAHQSGSPTDVQATAIAEWKALFEYCFVNAQ